MYVFRTEALRTALAERPSAVSLQQARWHHQRAYAFQSSCGECGIWGGSILLGMVLRLTCILYKRSTAPTCRLAACAQTIAASGLSGVRHRARYCFLAGYGSIDVR